MEKFYFILLIITIVALLIALILEGWFLDTPEDIVMVYGYNNQDEDGNEKYTIECFNYDKEKREVYNLDKDAYDKLLSDKGDFYKIYRKGKLGKRIFLVKINDDGILCD